MTSIASRLAQTWPRIVISLMHLAWVLRRAQEDNFTSPSMIISIAFNTTLIAYAVIRKSLIATWTLYGGWIVTTLFLLIWFVMIPVLLYMYSIWVRSEAKGMWAWAGDSVSAIVRDVVLGAVEGWAYVVHIRDLQGQRRDAWGRLVQDEGDVVLET
ncbi:MAG: hypothetical protein J3Q66DRAFT_364727 [Benniella sp.]|nr:MAG: hypothetical protein J3Q66DRAFT_364727 [Benniella sp.]